MDENRALVERVLAGETGAYEQFISQFQRLVAHVVFRMVDNPTDREDICQDVFIALYRGLKDFQFKAKLSTWVAKVAYYRCLNYLDKAKVPLFDDITDEEQQLDQVAGKTQTPAEFAELRDVSSRVREEIAQLPVHFRTVLTLYHLEQMSYQEIGEITDLPEGTIKSHLFRARKLLKKRLEARYRPEDLWQ
jgi:RNA polymerase sigma-70 factor (ECF subfamily)